MKQSGGVSQQGHTAVKVLGIETSCDETAAAIVEDGLRIVSSVIASQAQLHARYGGVVPEVASRMHLERMLPVLSDALAQGNLSWKEIAAIAVTNRPGLLGALLIGVSAAKALAYSLHVPIAAVHHIEGHIYSAFLAEPAIAGDFPLLFLIASGGHTQLVRMRDHGRYELLGSTRDDAAGEAFDKGARLLDLPYPGGPNLAELADRGDARRVRFPKADLGGSLDFSFSGVKTALRNYLRVEPNSSPADVAAGYQRAIVDSLVETTARAVRTARCRTLCVVGGVAANRSLCEKMARLAEEEGLHLVTPGPELCTDNAAMIAAAGHFQLERRGPDP
ncbi:MAG TPA: tRNA (adenosine(37)-N6)-threonylcarbamoyltransferase complex transferase subunit TsaD, partial [Chthonomonadales bacterium]|nr:tRNA (adenosine(37)-N6)-threonylcarbamoyltransferase complex transferase subunit TsaD [Chthonomonadales bacterium]